jgi:methylglyoxal reductase
MRYRSIGGSGIHASVVALGGAPISGWPWGESEERQAIAAIHRCLEEGINLIDTAPVYGIGRSEKLIGKAIDGKRDKVVIASKCGLVWHVSKGTPFHQKLCGKSIYRYLGPESIRYEIEKSLRRLNTDYIDLYQTHWQDPTTPISATMQTLLQLKQEGKIRVIGVSNCTFDQLRQYCALGPIGSVQEKYNMLHRAVEADLGPFCAQEEIALLAYTPLANGLLTGKVGTEREFATEDLRRDHPQFTSELRRRVQAMLEEMRPIATSYSATLTQLAIAWTVSHPVVTHALVGVRTAEQACENARAGSMVLRACDLKLLDEILIKHSMAPNGN